MTKVFFITSSFPYYPGEQFIETEINRLARGTGIDVTILPLRAKGEPRLVPVGVDVDLFLARRNSPWRKIVAVLKVPFNHFFWKELFFVFENKKHKTKNALRVARHGVSIVFVRDSLAQKLKEGSGKIVVYCYWNSTAAYASVLLKEKESFPISVVSRAHGGDLYEERDRYQYLPFKRQFLNAIDALLPVSFDGKRYLQNKFMVDPRILTTVPLGVEVPEKKCEPTASGVLSILSVSFLVDVKRVDRIVDALKCLASERRINTIEWRHIGDGPLLERLKDYAEEQLSGCGVDWAFLGNMNNDEVKSYYLENSVDVFVNSSESEGVPVSIMEAMSFGVPVVAPDVGGVKELVSSECGKLLSTSTDGKEICKALKEVYGLCKDKGFREKAHRKVVKDYNEHVNYGKLLEVLKAV